MRKLIFLLIVIILVGGFFRFFSLMNVPIQLNHDEITQLYDAISIAQTGHDIYGNFMPTIFVSVHDFKPPFYTYITSLIYFIFGNREIIIRLPAAFFGTLLIGGVFWFVKEILKERRIAFLAAALTTISPFEIFYSRKGFESGTGIFLMLLGFTFLLIYLRGKRFLWMLAGAIALSFSMYVYFAQSILVPIILLGFIWSFWDELKKIGIKNILIFSLIWVILILPLLSIILSNEGSKYRSRTVFLTQDSNLGRQLELDGFRYQIIGDYALNRYLKQFDPAYLFGNGLDLTNQGPIGMGPLFFIQLPFLLWGIYALFMTKNLSGSRKFIAVWIFVGMLPSGLTFEEFSPHRSIMVFTMFNVLSAVGLGSFIAWVRRLNGPRMYFLSAVVGLALLLNFVYFLHIYFVNYGFEKSQSIQYPFKEVALYAWSKHDEFDQIVFDPNFGQAAPIVGTGAHYYFGYYGNFPPAKMQKEYRVGSKPREVLFDKFSIRKIEWNEDISLRNTLLILSPWSVDPKILNANKDKIIKTFYFYDHQPAFYAISL